MKRSRRLPRDIRLAAEDPLKLGFAVWEFGPAVFLSNATAIYLHSHWSLSVIVVTLSSSNAAKGHWVWGTLSGDGNLQDKVFKLARTIGLVCGIALYT